MEEKETKVKKTTKAATKNKKVVEDKNIEKKDDVIIKEVVVEKRSGFNYAEVIVIMLISLILGGVVGSFINYIAKDNKKENVVVNTTNLPDGMDEFLEAYENILNNYYEDVDSKGLIEAGINGMLEYLGDDYSVYMNKDVTESFNEQVEGKYTGIGVEITLQQDGGVKINKIFENSPAEKSGLKVGDIFVSVNGKDVSKSNASDISNLIRNSESKNVKIVVKRDEVEKEFTLTLEEVDIESVSTKTFDVNGKKIGYIELSIFANNSYSQFKNKLEKLEKENIDSLIIDVRGNSGGYLSAVTDIASLFLNKNKIIYQLDTKGVVEQVYSKTSASRNYDIIVLIDEASASASEILASALQESYGATLVGTNSYGKGTVQTAYKLESGATVKYTIQKWLTPNGNWINEVGVTPDVYIKLDEDYLNNPTDENDKQLQKAIEELSK